MTTDAFDPAEHRLAENRYFEDFALGERFPLPSRTMTSAIFGAFQLASGDNHPIHYDVEFCKRRGHPAMLAHALQTFIQTAPGAGLFPHMVDDALIGLIEGSFRALKPVYLGDTLYAALTITDLKPQRTTGVVTMRATVHNQNRVLVMDGEQRLLIRKRAAA
jgi:acyl dehydratase